MWQVPRQGGTSRVTVETAFCSGEAQSCRAPGKLSLSCSVVPWMGNGEGIIFFSI